MGTCIFCDIALSKDKWVLESELCYAIRDIKPVTKGHTLVITKKHFDNLQLTDEDSLKDAISLVKKVADDLKRIYPDIKGFNYLSNQGKEAKQVIFHLHIHIIPRY